MAAGGTTELQYEPPGPGSWVLDPVHFPRPLTRYWMEIHPEPFRRGCAEFLAYYGTPLAAKVIAYINGFGYNTVVPAPDEEVPERFARAEEVFENKLWRGSSVNGRRSASPRPSQPIESCSQWIRMRSPTRS